MRYRESAPRITRDPRGALRETLTTADSAHRVENGAERSHVRFSGVRAWEAARAAMKTAAADIRATRILDGYACTPDMPRVKRLLESEDFVSIVRRAAASMAEHTQLEDDFLALFDRHVPQETETPGTASRIASLVFVWAGVFESINRAQGSWNMLDTFWTSIQEQVTEREYAAMRYTVTDPAVWEEKLRHMRETHTKQPIPMVITQYMYILERCMRQDPSAIAEAAKQENPEIHALVTPSELAKYLKDEGAASRYTDMLQPQVKKMVEKARDVTSASEPLGIAEAEVDPGNMLHADIDSIAKAAARLLVDEDIAHTPAAALLITLLRETQNNMPLPRKMQLHALRMIAQEVAMLARQRDASAEQQSAQYAALSKLYIQYENLYAALKDPADMGEREQAMGALIRHSIFSILSLITHMQLCYGMVEPFQTLAEEAHAPVREEALQRSIQRIQTERVRDVPPEVFVAMPLGRGSILYRRVPSENRNDWVASGWYVPYALSELEKDDALLDKLEHEPWFEVLDRVQHTTAMNTPAGCFPWLLGTRGTMRFLPGGGAQPLPQEGDGAHLFVRAVVAGLEQMTCFEHVADTAEPREKEVGVRHRRADGVRVEEDEAMPRVVGMPERGVRIVPWFAVQKGTDTRRAHEGRGMPTSPHSVQLNNKLPSPAALERAARDTHPLHVVVALQGKGTRDRVVRLPMNYAVGADTQVDYTAATDTVYERIEGALAKVEAKNRRTGRTMQLRIETYATQHGDATEESEAMSADEREHRAVLRELLRDMNAPLRRNT